MKDIQCRTVPSSVEHAAATATDNPHRIEPQRGKRRRTPELIGE
jgi:hypothetical protein